MNHPGKPISHAFGDAADAGRETPPWFRDPRSAAYRAVLVLLPGCAVLAVLLGGHFTRGPMGGYWIDAMQLAQTGRLEQHFTPAGYPAMIAPGAAFYRSNPERGVEAVQALLQMLMVGVLWGVLRELGATALAALAGTIALALHPELLITIVKIWDVSASAFLLLLAVYIALRILHGKAIWKNTLLLGAVWAFGCFDRPNYVLLLPAFLFVLWHILCAEDARWLRFSALVAALLLTTCVTYAACSAAVYGQVLFPGNGPYNVYAGQNRLSEQALLQHLNGEPSVVPSLLEQHRYAEAASAHDLAWRAEYSQSARIFAKTHPVEELRLVAVKLFTLLRRTRNCTLCDPLPACPSFSVVWAYRYGSRSWSGSGAGGTANGPQRTPSFVWSPRSTFFHSCSPTPTPRFRTGLEVLAVAHAVALWARGGQTGDGYAE